MGFHNVTRSLPNNLQYTAKPRGVAGTIGHFLKKLGYYLTCQSKVFEKNEQEIYRKKESEVHTIAVNIMQKLPSYENLEKMNKLQGEVLYIKQSKSSKAEGYKIELIDSKIIGYKYEIHPTYTKARKPFVIKSEVKIIADLTTESNYYSFKQKIEETHGNSSYWIDHVDKQVKKFQEISHPAYGRVIHNLPWLVWLNAARLVSADPKFKQQLEKEAGKSFDEFDTQRNKEDLELLTKVFLENNPDLLQNIHQLGIGNPTIEPAIKSTINENAARGTLTEDRYDSLVTLLNQASRLINPREAVFVDNVQAGVQAILQSAEAARNRVNTTKARILAQIPITIKEAPMPKLEASSRKGKEKVN
ncbi:MAG: hypothetical protein ACK4M7_07835 [Burkholderiales bacterium]